jgi:hypothetical protein
MFHWIPVLSSLVGPFWWHMKRNGDKHLSVLNRKCSPCRCLLKKSINNGNGALEGNKVFYCLNNAFTLSTKWTKLETKRKLIMEQSKKKNKPRSSLPKMWERYCNIPLFHCFHPFSSFQFSYYPFHMRYKIAHTQYRFHAPMSPLSHTISSQLSMFWNILPKFTSVTVITIFHFFWTFLRSPLFFFRFVSSFAFHLLICSCDVWIS